MAKTKTLDTLLGVAMSNYIGPDKFRRLKRSVTYIN